MVFSKLEKVLLAKLGIDVARTPIARKAAYAIALRAAQIVAPVTVPIAGAVGQATPYAIGAGLGYAALQTDPGQELLAAAEERGRQDRIRFERFVQDTMALGPPPSLLRRKKRMTPFNASVKKGMAIVKASTSYGKKGTISNAKKAFSAVTKTISKVNRGKPKPKKGILKKVALMAGRLLPKKKKAVRKRKSYIDYDPQGTMFD